MYMRILVFNFSFLDSLSPSQQCDNNQSIIEASSLSLSSTNLTACGPSNQESDVNTSSLSISTATATTITTTATTKNTPTKWTCSNCTYLNMSKSTSRCVQCTTKRTENELNLFNEQMKSLNLADDPEQLATSNRISPMGSATNLSGSRTNLGAGARISPVEQRSYPLSKWMCSVSSQARPSFYLFFFVVVVFSYVLDVSFEPHLLKPFSVLIIISYLIFKMHKLLADEYV